MTTAAPRPGRTGTGSQGLIPDWLDHRFTQAVAPVIRRLILTRVRPDAITVAAFLTTALGAVLIARGQWMAAGLSVIVGGILDFSDGKVATLTGRVTVFGGILDSTLDRYADAAIYLGLARYFSGGGHDLATAAALMAMVGSMTTSYLDALGRAHGHSVRGGLLRRQDRVSLVAAGLLLAPLSPSLTTALRSMAPALLPSNPPALPLAAVVLMLAILTNVTAVQRLRILHHWARSPSAAPSGETLRDRQIQTLRAAILPEARREARNG